MFETVLKAITVIAKRHNMPQVYVIKKWTVQELITDIAELLEIEEWEYGRLIFDEIVNIARISGMKKVGQYDMSDLDEYGRQFSKDVANYIKKAREVSL